MQSPKYKFYLQNNNNILSFDKKMMIYMDNMVNMIRWNEIHITQFVIHKKYKNELLLDDKYYCKSITMCIENFDENINENQDIGNYTISILDISLPYVYNGMYNSKVVNRHNFTEKNDKIELKIRLMNGSELLDNYFYTDNQATECDIIEIELFFKC